VALRGLREDGRGGTLTAPPKKRRNEMRLRRGTGIFNMDGDKRERAEALLYSYHHALLKKTGGEVG
jgi:hypothetical protein